MVGRKQAKRRGFALGEKFLRKLPRDSRVRRKAAFKQLRRTRRQEERQYCRSLKG